MKYLYVINKGQRIIAASDTIESAVTYLMQTELSASYYANFADIKTIATQWGASVVIKPNTDAPGHMTQENFDITLTEYVD